jgi:hypothetical protein
MPALKNYDEDISDFYPGAMKKICNHSQLQKIFYFEGW